MTREYDAVIFDLDGVLLDSDRDGFAWANAIRREADHDLRELRVLFETGSLEEFREKVSRYDFGLEYLKEVEGRIAERKLELVRNGEIKMYSDVGDLLESLEIPVAVISNAYGEILEEILEEVGLGNSIDFYYAPSLSDIEKYREEMKPNPYMLDLAIDRLGSRNPLMVGDSSSDVEAAERAGIDSVYLSRDGEENEDADYNIQGLVQLEDIIKG